MTRSTPADARAGEKIVGGLGARVQMRVRVDHAAAGSSMRGKSGAAGSIPSIGPVLPGSTFSHSMLVGCPSASRIMPDVVGTKAASATATQRRPSARS